MIAKTRYTHHVWMLTAMPEFKRPLPVAAHCEKTSISFVLILRPGLFQYTPEPRSHVSAYHNLLHSHRTLQISTRQLGKYAR
jgi:hypothetical protein